MSTELVAHGGQEAFRISTEAAQLCKQIVVATAKQIKNRKFVCVEGWQAIALAHGCVASAGEVERVATGFRAIGKVIRMNDGQVLSTAEGFVGDDEPMWASRPEFARRAMAQTRSISRACRSAFAHVVVMMQAGLETTPAEEMHEEKVVNPTDREAELTALSKEAGLSVQFYLNRAQVKTVAELSDDDYAGAVANLKKRIAEKQKAAA